MGGRAHVKNWERPHERGLPVSKKPPMLRDFKANQKAVHGPRGKGLDRLPVSRGAWRWAEGRTQRHVSSWSFHERGREGTANASRASAAMCEVGRLSSQPTTKAKERRSFFIL